MKSTQHSGREHSQLFLARLWKEESTDSSETSQSEIEWCGRLQHVVSGEWAYFEGLSGPGGLLAVLELMIKRYLTPPGADPKESKGSEDQ